MPRFVQGVAVGATPSISADASHRGWRLPAGKRKLAGALLAAFVFLALLRDAMDGTRALEHADVDPARHTPRGSHDLTRDHAASRDARLLRPGLDADDQLSSPESSLDVDERLRVPTAATAAASRQADPARLSDPSSCDAALVDKIDEIERQAARWQAMVLQRAREHTERAVAEARGILGGASSGRGPSNHDGVRAGLERERWCDMAEGGVGSVGAVPRPEGSVGRFRVAHANVPARAGRSVSHIRRR